MAEDAAFSKALENGASLDEALRIAREANPEKKEDGTTSSTATTAIENPEGEEEEEEEGEEPEEQQTPESYEDEKKRLMLQEALKREQELAKAAKSTDPKP
ncbi:hypothetical protein Emag_005786 [Eimeria magna]